MVIKWLLLLLLLYLLLEDYGISALQMVIEYAIGGAKI